MPPGPYIPNWFQEFYASYGALIGKRKKHATTFKSVDYIVVWEKRVKWNDDIIDAILDHSTDIGD